MIGRRKCLDVYPIPCWRTTGTHTLAKYNYPPSWNLSGTNGSSQNTEIEETRITFIGASDDHCNDIRSVSFYCRICYGGDFEFTCVFVVGAERVLWKLC